MILSLEAAFLHLLRISRLDFLPLTGLHQSHLEIHLHNDLVMFRERANKQRHTVLLFLGSAAARMIISELFRTSW